MDDLTLVGVHDDGEHLLLTAPDGRRLRLRVDDALRAAVRRDRARLGQIQIAQEGKLRPRDIQARIRAGHSAEEIADEAQVPLAFIRRFEGPVLAEREYVAVQARAAVVRRGTAGEPRTLEELVLERLGGRGIDPEVVEWDSWRADDGAWVVAADYPGEGEGRSRARWRYDQANRHVTALDQAAQLLSEQEQRQVPTGPRRLAPVPGVEVEAPSAWIDLPDAGGVLEVDPFGSSAGANGNGHGVDGGAAASASAAAGAPPAVDLLDTLRERRGRRSRPLIGEEDERPGADPVRDAIDSLREREALDTRERADLPAPTHPAGRGVTGATGSTPAGSRPAGSRPAGSKPAGSKPAGSKPVRPQRSDRRPPDVLAIRETPPDPGAPVLPAHRPTDGARTPAPSRPEAIDPSHPEPVHDPVAGRKRGRASVPSWDDIVFGSRRD